MEIPTFLALIAFISASAVGLSLVLRYRHTQAEGRARAAHRVDIARYAPMERLLSPDDLQMLSADPELARRFRNHRCRIFRGYLRCLNKDFHALLAGAREILMSSATPQPRLANLLTRSERTFIGAMIRLQFVLVVYKYTGKVLDVTATVEGLRNIVSAIQTPIAASSAA